MTKFVTITVDAVPENILINLEHVKMMFDNQSGCYIQFIDGETVESTMKSTEILALASA